MDKSKVFQGAHRGAVTKIIHQTDEKLQTDVVSRQELKATIQTLERKHTLLQDIDSKILENTETEDIEQEIIDSDEFNLQVEATIIRYKEILEKSNTPTPMVSDFSNSTPQTTHASTSQDANQNTMSSSSIQFTNNAVYDTRQPIETNYQPQRFCHKLPTLDLPAFSGDILLWQTFWESFESTVHANPALTNIQKFAYLKAQLRSDAERCISGLSLTHANYDQAVNLLKDRFGRQNKIIDAHMQKLIDLPNPVMSLHSLRIFYDKIETSIRGLESLGQCQDTYGALLTPIIFRKLPAELRKNLTREHGSYNWDIDTLRKAIGKELEVQEAGKTNYTDDIQPTATASFVTRTSAKPNQTHKYQFTQNQSRKTSPKCTYCDQSHFSAECTNFKDSESRYAVAKRKQLCFNCLGQHKASECRSKYKCRKCDKKHHTSLCDKGEISKTSTRQTVVNSINTETSTETDSAVPTSAYYTSLPPAQPNTEILLKTAVSPVWYNNHNATANILLDEGSQKSFISEELAIQLDIKPSGTTTINLATFGDTSRNIRHMDKATINLETQNGKILRMDVLIVPQIAAPLSNIAHVEATKLPYLKSLKLAHPVTGDQKFEISLLIGADYYWSIVEDRVIRGQGPTAVKSTLGYLLSGPVNTKSNENSALMMNILTCHKFEEHNLERFWNLESMGITETENSNSKDVSSFHELYQEKGIEYKNNRYCAKLPWTDDCPELPTNKNIVMRRTENVIKRLNREPEMLKIYGGIIADQEKRGFIERVPEQNETNGSMHYIPHHAVKKDSATTPIRIVYDCSCRESVNSPSLNDCLMSVTPLLNALTGILARFRLHKYAVSTDIEKAFLQIELHQDDRDVTRFFWLSDPEDATSPLITYRFKSILFGTTCSPFILNTTILKHLKLNPCETTNILKRDLYVDNVLSSFEEKSELMSFYQESRSILSNGGFNLRSWSSNNQELRDIAKTENCLDSDKLIKILGLRWKVESDEILFQNNLSTTDEIVTKRDILRESSKIFDPLGLLSPITVRAKLLMQTLWERMYAWDTYLPDDIQSEWKSLRNDLLEVVNLKFPRYDFDGVTETDSTMHVFTDASQRAYGACAYITRGNQSSLIMARNRVAPLKLMTLPRLELMGTVVGVRLARHLMDNIGEMHVNFWCDSQIVLKWINSSKPLKKFIANRIIEIKQQVKHQTWRYCPTGMNPADLLTRGVIAKVYCDSDLWPHGPEWITRESDWPIWDGNIISSLNTIAEEEYMEIQNIDTVTEVVTSISGIEVANVMKIIELDRFSNLRKLIRVTALVLRFIRNCKVERSERNFDRHLCVDELQLATRKWIIDVQQEHFQEEIKCINRETHISSIVRQLRLFEDENGLIRCGGRLNNACISDLAKYPYLLPTKHKFTSLVVMDAHVNQLHGGINSTVTQLRQTYWIPKIRQCVKNIIRKCVTCTKVSGRPYPIPDPPPLPKDRLQDSIPFHVTGVDFAGPLYIRDSENNFSKAYICLFTCASTRAVHLEIVSNLTEECFMLAFRRFTSRRSVPRTMISDNATTYIAASKSVADLTHSTTLQDRLSCYGTTWKFIPKRAPWYGGFWERMIGLTKNSLKKVLGRSCISLEQLRTVIIEIEAYLNDRPITYVSSEVNDPEPLTPSHLLCGRRITSLPYPSDSSIDLNSGFRQTQEDLNNRNKYISDLLSHFKNRWRSEYLTSLREYHRAVGNNTQNIHNGDIVQIHEDNSPRVNWKLGVIEELVYGRDGMVRSVKLRTKNGITNRPISKLYPLEVDTVPQKKCETRKAKEQAKERIREWTSLC